MELHFTDSAFQDLSAIKAHYASEGMPHIGEGLIRAILDHVEILVEHPDIGREVPEFGVPRIRELIHAPFRVVYLRETGAIHVVRIWRSERQLELP